MTSFALTCGTEFLPPQADIYRYGSLGYVAQVCHTDLAYACLSNPACLRLHLHLHCHLHMSLEITAGSTLRHAPALLSTQRMLWLGRQMSC